MPASVPNASVSLVMPWALCSSFGRSQIYPARRNVYRGTEQQITLEAGNSRKSWDIAQRLTPANLATMLAFHATVGTLTPFFFYDPWDTSPKFNYDPSGTATTGRYVVRFEGPLTTDRAWPRHDLTFRLIEIT